MAIRKCVVCGSEEEHDGIPRFCEPCRLRYLRDRYHITGRFPDYTDLRWAIDRARIAKFKRELTISKNMAATKRARLVARQMKSLAAKEAIKEAKRAKVAAKLPKPPPPPPKPLTVQEILNRMKLERHG